jgi:hypothetical protein
MQAESKPSRAGTRRLGALACVIYVIHGAHHAYNHELYHLMWVCNMAVLLLAIGCLLPHRALVTIALMWLVGGTPLWILDLLSGSSLMWSSLLTHLGGPVIAFMAVRRLGTQRRLWIWATAGVALLMAASRTLTSEPHNINVAHHVLAGWETVFPVYSVYLLFLLGLAIAIFFVVEQLLVRVFVRVHP